MTYSIHNVINVFRVSAGKEAGVRPFSGFSWLWQKIVTYLFACHYGHLLEFSVSLLCYFWLWPQTFPHAATFSFHWVSKVFAFNLGCELIFYGFWHWMMYSGEHVNSSLKAHKFNPEQQYEDPSEGHLIREVFFTTLGWLQSSTFMCVMMFLWASGKVPYIPIFFGSPSHTAFNIASVLFVTYWREFHFYWCHRFMHAWWPSSNSMFDLGRFIYRWVHSLHHKSVNPGPFSGLSMSPLEHFFYYTCTLLPLLLPLHPLHFLYAKFHADIAPVGGHDGYAFPGGGGDFHYLHHAKFDCNYGVPLIDFDWMFGSWVDYKCFVEAGGKDLDKGLKLTNKRFGWLGEKRD